MVSNFHTNTNHRIIFYFKEKLDGERFDAIAYGVQKRTEELLTVWISNGINQTGIKNVVMSGGVAQNIKANQKITELNKLEQLFIPPGPSDESISIGAAFLEYQKTKEITNENTITSAYMGISFNDLQVKEAIDHFESQMWRVKQTSPNEVAQFLAKETLLHVLVLIKWNSVHAL